LGEAFVAEPTAHRKPEFERCAGAVAEDVDGTAQWVLGQGLATQRNEAINAFRKSTSCTAKIRLWGSVEH
jgi:hypothetical protein